ncbi:MAG: glycosyltransferase family protein [Candidatus Marinimicrobia bacterium]|nr:glycosyltransferase family protein [Candidatus Neomarinimicrobiota bacterium]
MGGTPREAHANRQVVCIIQARMSSTRLPGKVLMPILERPMLQHLLERVGRAKTLSKVIIATSTDESDDPVAALCSDLSVHCFRGDLHDVLDRYFQAARAASADHVVRITGDCPLIDPEIIDQVVRVHLEGNFDYTSNVQLLTYPDGLDTEVMTFATLERSAREAQLPSEREHVTHYIVNHPEAFNIGEAHYHEDHSALRWTVDEPEDFELISKIFQNLYPQNPKFDWQDVLKYLETNPVMKTYNIGHMRNAGHRTSLELDKKTVSR